MVATRASIDFVALLRWDDPSGVPAHTVPGLVTSLAREVDPPARRASPVLRALPDGAVQLVSAVSDRRFVALRLGGQRRLEFDTRANLLDVVVAADGSAAILEESDTALVVTRVDSDGEREWSVEAAAPGGPASLLSDGRGFVYLASAGQLSRIEEGALAPLARRQAAGEIFMAADGDIAFVSYDDERRTRDWIVLDPAAGTREAVAGNEQTSLVFAAPIGVDALHRGYGYYDGLLGRVDANGELGWRLPLRGIAVNGRHGACLLEREGQRWRFVTPDRSITPRAALPFDAQLIGFDDDERISLYSSSIGGHYGTIVLVDASGEIVGNEPAQSDVWLTHSDFRPPNASSVTPDGAVVVAVLAPEGLHVLELRAR